MEAIYPYAHIIHLILAIMFLGYVFTDLAVISALKGKFDKENQQKVNQSLGKRSFKIFPVTLLFLVLTGGMMMSKYINSTAGFAEYKLTKDTSFQNSFSDRIIVIGVGSNLYIKFTGGTKSNFMQNHFHKLVIVLGLFIVIAAKAMFMV